MAQRPWIAFFSQTGSEIVNLQQALGRTPDLIVTNDRPDHLRAINEGIELCYMMPNKPTLSDYEGILSAYENPLVTLHGWLRIIPGEIADEYEIYNGHPGLITLYPDLKGKDPQVKAWEANYKTIGSVVHRVTAGVDEGPVVLERAYNSDKLLSLDDTFRILHNISTDLWIKFLKERLW